MESISIISVVLLFSYVIYLINRYNKAVHFRNKVIRYSNNLINEAIMERNEYKLNLFMRGRNAYLMYHYLLSFKPLKLHNFFSREFIQYINEYKRKQKGEDILERAKVYNNCARL